MLIREYVEAMDAKYVKMKKIRIYKSFEEQELKEAELKASVDGVQLIASMVRRVKALYPPVSEVDRQRRRITIHKR